MNEFADLAETERAAREAFDVRLFTVLGIDGDEVFRIWSSDPEAYPVGGRKSLSRDISPEWRAACIDGREVFLGLTPDDVRRVFADHELIARLGCGAIANAPVIQDGEVIGSLCILTPEGGLTADDAETARGLALASRGAVARATAASQEAR